MSSSMSSELQMIYPSSSMSSQNTWIIRSLPSTDLQWGRIHNGTPHACISCGIILLTGEKAGFCCGPNGSRLHDVPPLPPLPDEYAAFANDPHIASLSRILNLIFSF